MAKSLYSMHPGFEMEAGYRKNLLERTGKTYEQWVEVTKKSGPPTEKERREWLKTKHGHTTTYAWWIAEGAAGKKSGADGYEPEAYVEAMFAGKKAALRPIYDKLLKLGLSMGADVKACPCQTIVPLYRKHVFAQIKPTTLTRVDMGFALKDRKATGRLIDTGGFAKKDRITHRIEITAPAQVDDEVKRWMKTAYEMDA